MQFRTGPREAKPNIQAEDINLSEGQETVHIKETRQSCQSGKQLNSAGLKLVFQFPMIF